MRFLKAIRLVLTFYRSFYIATTAITACCAWVICKNGISAFSILFWFKIAALLLTCYFVKNYKAKEVYYYQNLGISKVVLWSCVMALDFALFIVSTIVACKIYVAQV